MNTKQKTFRDNWERMSFTERANWLSRGVPSARLVMNPDTGEDGYVAILRGASVSPHLFETREAAVAAAEEFRKYCKEKSVAA